MSADMCTAVDVNDKYQVGSVQMHSLSLSQVVLVVKNPLANAGDVRNGGFDPWVGKISWRRI